MVDVRLARIKETAAKSKESFGWTSFLNGENYNRRRIAGNSVGLKGGCLGAERRGFGAEIAAKR
nr:hypothetical protein [Tanacetum cinerariifolium]